MLKGGKNFKLQKITTVILFLTLTVVIFLFALPVFAQETNYGFEYVTEVGLGTVDVRLIIMRIVRVALGFLGIVALIIVLYGGYLWMTSAGDPEKINKAKRTLVNAVIGLLIILAAFSIVSFIVTRMAEIMYGPPVPPTPPPCTNCSALGGGIIESVYPEPGARDVPRDTMIFVTFKELMDADTIISATGKITDDIKIYISNEGEASALPSEDVNASTTDNKTFKFDPLPYLGDGQNNIWYTVKLSDGIEKANGESAFPGVPGYFDWSFEVGTKLDLGPPTVVSVFPPPDDLADSYETTGAVQATGSITVESQPNPGSEASYDTVATVLAGPLGATVSGTYNGTFAGDIEITLSDDTAAATANVFWELDHPNNNPTAEIIGETIILGSGLSLLLDGDHAGDGAINKWRVTNVTPYTEPDTLQVANKVYTFVLSGATGDQINVGDDPTATASNIANKVDGDTQSPNVAASATGNIVNLTAVVAGSSGNNIIIQASGDWATISPMSGGTDAETTTTPNDKSDQPRNAIIRIDFSEAMDPTVVSGVVDTDDLNSVDGMGGLLIGVDFNYITVQADVNGDTVFEDDEYVAGEFSLSNQYKTVEFTALHQCEDEFGNPIENSCGEPIYCLPIAQAVSGSSCSIDSDCNSYPACTGDKCYCSDDNQCVPYTTNYKVTIKTASLETCTTDNDCLDPSYENCTDNGNGILICNSGTVVGEGTNYPKADLLLNDGVIDASNNSLDGNKNNSAQGPQSQSGLPPYSLNDELPDTGDSVEWSFYINDRIDLEPPIITAVEPKVLDMGANLSTPISATFNKLLLSNTLKPDSGYPPDTEEKFVTLYDYSINPVGYWISNYGQDTSSPPDGYDDITVAQINHTNFTELTNYSAEIGSGVRDIYQNCYLPSEGPAVDTCDPQTGVGCCGVDLTVPYCCEGVASDEPCI